MSVNKFGLSRKIPSGIRQEVRKRCGFGCVICGLGFYDYEHFAPDFSEAIEHNPLGMTLLCSQCNQKRARGRLSAITVAIANSNPKCLQKGFANELFDFGVEPIEVQFAGVKFYNCNYLIVVNDIPILVVAPPLETRQSVRLSGRFSNWQGRPTLIINDNAWQASTENWDVEVVGPRIKIRSGRGDISLIIKMEPPHRIVIEHLEMYFNGVYFRGNEKLLETSINGDGWSKFQQIDISHCRVGISFNIGRAAANEAIFEVSQ